AGPEGLHGREDTGERGLLHSPAVGRAQHEHLGAVQVAVGGGQQVHGVLGHRGVRLTGGAHDGRGRVVPQVHPRVDRDAVAADRDARLVDVAVGLRVAGLDDLLDVDAVAVGEPRELVGQADVDVPVGGLGQLGQLGRLGRAQVPDAVRAGQVVAGVEVEDRLVEGDTAGGGRLVDAADQL